MPDIVKNGSQIFLKVSGKWYYYDERQAPLGAGSMGVVYLGFSKDKNYPVAIKRVNDKYANVPSIRERAKLEAKLQFRHQNLIEMIGYCELNPTQGPLYILSNYIHGKNIDRYIRETFPPQAPNRAAKICQLFYPVLDALTYIHSNQIVHMDIKPSNIIVEDGRNIRLLDLGIAHVGKKIDIDSSASLMGTPKYAAPEQFDVNINTSLKPETDIYAAGVTLYELLCGKNPYSANTISDSITKHKNVILPYDSLIPKKLVDVLRTATNPNPALRFKSASEFKQAIAQSLISRKSFNWVYVIVSVAIATLLIVIIVLLIYGQSN